MIIYGIRTWYYDAEYEKHEWLLRTFFRKKESADEECERLNNEERKHWNDPTHSVVEFELKQ